MGQGWFARRCAGNGGRVEEERYVQNSSLKITVSCRWSILIGAATSRFDGPAPFRFAGRKPALAQTGRTLAGVALSVLLQSEVAARGRAYLGMLSPRNRQQLTLIAESGCAKKWRILGTSWPGSGPTWAGQAEFHTWKVGRAPAGKLVSSHMTRPRRSVFWAQGRPWAHCCFGISATGDTAIIRRRPACKYGAVPSAVRNVAYAVRGIQTRSMGRRCRPDCMPPSHWRERYEGKRRNWWTSMTTGYCRQFLWPALRLPLVRAGARM